MLGEDGEEVAPEQKEIFGEEKDHRQLLIPEVIVEKALTFQEASKCLNTLGKDESGLRYAYLKITATDRKLTDIKTILNFKHLLFIDVSGNYLKLDDLDVLSDMPFLILLKAERNHIESCALKSMPYLQVLSLSNNEITETCDINQPLLECLNLNYNQIYTVQFVEGKLPVIKQLEMRGNQMFDLSGTFPTTIEALYLAQNKISKIIASDIENLQNLKILHLRDNQLRKLNGFTSALCNLKYLNLRQNKINKFRQFAKLKCLTQLEVLIVLQNPVAGEELKEGEGGGGGGGDDDELEGEDLTNEDVTRIPILVLLPNLKRINKGIITIKDREEMYEIRDEKYEEIMAEESSDDDDDDAEDDDDEIAATTTATTTDYTTDEQLDNEETTADDNDE